MNVIVSIWLVQIECKIVDYLSEKSLQNYSLISAISNIYGNTSFV